MARPTSKFTLAIAALVLMAAPALAQNYDYLSRSDSISLSAGNANAANTAIQTPTPWPWYVNSTHIHSSAVRGVKNITDYNNGVVASTPDADSGSSTSTTMPSQ